MNPGDGVSGSFLSPEDGVKGSFFSTGMKRGELKYGGTDYAHGSSVQADRQIGDWRGEG